MGDEELEEEFRKLTEQFAGSDELQLDENLASLEEKRTCVGLVLAPMDNTGALAAFLKLAGMETPVVRTEPWAAAYLRFQPQVESEADDLALLTGARAIPAEVDKIAREVSKLSAYGAVAVVSWLSEDEGFESGITGSLSAKRYLAGEPEEDLPAGIVMNTLNNIAEDLLLGRAEPGDFPDQKGGWKDFFRRPGSKS